MEQDGRKKILIILGILLIVSSIIAIVLSMISNNNVNPGGTGSTGTGSPSGGSTGGGSTTEEISKEITRLEDEEIFFSIQNILNEYYSNLAKQNSQTLYQVLDSEYLEESGITQSNILNRLKTDYEAVAYIAKEIYYNDNSRVTYYFVNGYVYNATMAEDNYTYEKNVNYLVIVDSNREYVIKPLDTNINILDYANSYNLVSRDFDNNIKYTSVEISEKNKLITYINEFLKLLFYDTERAYNMLDNETKSKYMNYEEFRYQINDIYNNVSTNIFSFSKKEFDGYVEYYIKDQKQRTIKIIETGVMDYQINYE